MTLLTWHIAGQAPHKAACHFIGLSSPGRSVPVQCAHIFMARMQFTCAAYILSCVSLSTTALPCFIPMHDLMDYRLRNRSSDKPGPQHPSQQCQQTVHNPHVQCEQVPLAVISGHKKAVSYVRWMDGSRLISASTDNLLKLWDVNSGIASGGQHDSSPVNVLSGLSSVIPNYSVLTRACQEPCRIHIPAGGESLVRRGLISARRGKLAFAVDLCPAMCLHCRVAPQQAYIYAGHSDKQSCAICQRVTGPVACSLPVCSSSLSIDALNHFSACCRPQQ